MHATLPLLKATDFPAISRKGLEALQVNVGCRCNQSCTHCHVAAGPNRTEEMSRHNVEAVLAFLEKHRVPTLDVTGGAPELHPLFRDLVSRARALGGRVIDRCNLTILEEPGQAGLADFLAAERAEVIASLPCYLEDNVDRQRGKGVFEASIRALRRLNAQGYGKPGTGLLLDLIYNPQGPTLPPPQANLEADFKRELGQRFGIVFNRLYTLTNMPIQRFGSMLVSAGRFDEYMALLRNAYQPANLRHVMCRSLVSIDWEGFVYDCDFNQMLGLPLAQGRRARTHISQLEVATIPGQAIRVADHCYGCAAGQGSSCGGALTA